MANEWLYRQNNKNFGPVSSSELKQLANAGELAVDDPLSRDGGKTWAKAGNVKGLFTERIPPRQSPPPVPQSTSPPQEPNKPLPIPPQDTASKQTLGQRAATFTANAKAAGQLAMLEAERTKLTQVSLPSAYRSLGKSIYKAGRFRDELAESYESADKIVSEIKLLQAEPFEQLGDSFSERAKTLANQTKNAAKAKVLSGKLAIAQRNLGKVAYNRFGKESGDEQDVEAIDKLLARIAELDQNIGATATTDRFLSQRRMLIGVGCFAAIAILFALFLRPTTNEVNGPNGPHEWSAYNLAAHFSEDVEPSTPKPGSNLIISGFVCRTKTMTPNEGEEVDGLVLLGGAHLEVHVALTKPHPPIRSLLYQQVTVAGTLFGKSAYNGGYGQHYVAVEECELKTAEKAPVPTMEAAKYKRKDVIQAIKSFGGNVDSKPTAQKRFTLEWVFSFREWENLLGVPAAAEDTTLLYKCKDGDLVLFGETISYANGFNKFLSREGSFL